MHDAKVHAPNNISQHAISVSVAELSLSAAVIVKHIFLRREMNTNQRRKFLATLAAGTTGAVLNPGNLLAGSVQRGTIAADVLLPIWNRSRDCTLEYTAAMPEATFLFKPVPEVRSFGEQMLHIAESNVFFVSSYLNTSKQLSRDYTPDGKTKAQTLELVKEAFDFAGEAINELTDAQLVESVDTFVGPLTKGEIVRLMKDHVTHHRGQTVVYLRLNGITPPTWVGH
jgi:uncharacterized damage-inducible protein DinB